MKNRTTLRRSGPAESPPPRWAERLPRPVLAALGELFPLVSALALFALLLGLLDATDYGYFATATSVALIVGPIARLGAQLVLMRDIGAGRDREEAWRESVGVTLTGGVVIGMLWAALAPIVLPALPFVPGQLLFTQQLIPLAVADLAASYLIVNDRLADSVLLRLRFALWRLAGLAVFWALDTDSLEILGLCLIGSGTVATLDNLHLVGRVLGVRSAPLRPTTAVALRGLPDSASSTTGTVLDSIDRPILTQAGFVADTGRYSAAMRIVGLGGLPTITILRLYDPRLYRAGAEGVGPAGRVMAAATARTLPLATLGAAGLFGVATLLPDLLPDDYAEAADILRWGVWMLPMRAVSFPFGNALTASGHRMTRLYLTMVAAGGNVVGNLLLIPTLTWRAAVWTTLGAEAFLAVGCVVSCVVLARRAPASLPDPAGEADADRAVSGSAASPRAGAAGTPSS